MATRKGTRAPPMSPNPANPAKPPSTWLEARSSTVSPRSSDHNSFIFGMAFVYPLSNTVPSRRPKWNASRN